MTELLAAIGRSLRHRKGQAMIALQVVVNEWNANISLMDNV